VQRDDDPRDGGRDFDVDLVGRHVDERLAFVNPLTDALTPLDDRAFGNGFPHFG
jgi:hypothetical protein